MIDRRALLVSAAAAVVAPSLPGAHEQAPPMIHVLYEAVVEHGVEYLPGWYFWDEVWVDRHGPFATYDETVAAVDVYCREWLGP